jgi:SAM-dependent MidA family methyltransferase
MSIGPYQLIVDLIELEGPIAFDTFMDLALYSEEGFYSDNNIGLKGDYYTSPTLHPVFSAFIATQINYIWEYLKKPNPFLIVELGCSNGILAEDIVTSLSSASNGIQDAFHYVAVDRMGTTSHSDKIDFMQSELPPVFGGVGIVIANELFDAFPVKRFEIVSGLPHEILVGISEEKRLIELIDSEPLDTSNSEYLKKFDLPEGYQGILNPNIDTWFESLNKTLDKGFFLTFDYGYEEQDYYLSNRSGKHIQTYYKHIDGLGLFDHVGTQDITSHVNFTSVIDSGIRHEFKPVILKSQHDWMLDMKFYDALEPSDLARQEISLIDSFMDLQGLGGFLMSMQQKNIETVNYCELIPSVEFVLNNFNIPPVTSSHLAHKIKFPNPYRTPDNYI